MKTTKQSDIRKASILKGVIVVHHVAKTPSQIKKEKQSAINTRRHELGLMPLRTI